MSYYDTIAAVSTPRGFGGVAMIRISGPDAIAVGERMFVGSLPLSGVESNRAVYGKIYLENVDGSRRCVDDGIAVVFRAPRSFTGEDTVEITCHGGVLVTETVLTAAFAAGARPAEAGEFTRRAFVNGKLGLTEAEALGSLLVAGTQDQLDLARGGMSGALARGIEEIYASLLAVSTAVRAKIDFPEEDLAELTDEEIRVSIEETLALITKLAGTYRTGKAVAQGIPTVICGRTNAGKSSLYNRMVGEDAAIVTDIEGTTRDVISETVSFGGVTLRLYDTAGLRKTDDPVEKIGIERARAAMEKAELIIALFDGSRELDEEDLNSINEIKKISAGTVAVINKSDLPKGCDLRPIYEAFPDAIEISTLSGEGLEKLAARIGDAFIDRSLDLAGDAIVTNERQYGALTLAARLLRGALEALEIGVPVDAVCSDIERAMSAVAGVDGREVGEDIVGAIFANFCVGK
ncbi:MAG: tRNA uridine-5-carboxymethylaminomethyl(34) synthesis GTPase MnmE [Clostridia bacterium]|nr:tRNA uridine-5-carboxymethylaminomethyl(34) synthesis GTPase MnmE [Clostridia bacterium]